MTGFYEDGEFKAGTVENLTTGETIILRDETGRPMWAGAGTAQESRIGLTAEANAARRPRQVSGLFSSSRQGCLVHPLEYNSSNSINEESPFRGATLTLNNRALRAGK